MKRLAETLKLPDFQMNTVSTVSLQGQWWESLVMGNLMNVAESLGLGSIWIHRAKEECILYSIANYEFEEGESLIHVSVRKDERGIYHLSRMISSQLEVVNKKTNYDKLEKAYCISLKKNSETEFLNMCVEKSPTSIRT